MGYNRESQNDIVEMGSNCGDYVEKRMASYDNDEGLTVTQRADRAQRRRFNESLQLKHESTKIGNLLSGLE